MKTTKLDEWAMKSKQDGVSYGKLQQEETLEMMRKQKAKEVQNGKNNKC